MDDHAGSSGSADSVACPPEELEEKVSKRRKAAKLSEAPVVLPSVPPPAPPLSAPLGLEPAGLSSSSASASTSSSSSGGASSSSGAAASSSGAAASSSEQLGGRALDASGDGGGADGGVPPPLAPAPFDRRARKILWGPFQLAEVHSKGIKIGWGATCGAHTNDSDAAEVHPPACKKQITFGIDGLTDADLRVRMKRRPIAGMHMLDGTGNDRKHHVKINARELTEFEEADLDALAATL